MKRNWEKLKENKCPTPGCLLKGKKTQLIVDTPAVLTCPKCGGRWELTLFSPMDICWVETKTPRKEAPND